MASKDIKARTKRKKKIKWPKIEYNLRKYVHKQAFSTLNTGHPGK